MHCLLPHGTNSVSKQMWRYLRSLPVSSATTIINITHNKYFLFSYINDKSKSKKTIFTDQAIFLGDQI